jgi:hypothetical protein
MQTADETGVQVFRKSDEEYLFFLVPYCLQDAWGAHRREDTFARFLTSPTLAFVTHVISP